MTETEKQMQEVLRMVEERIEELKNVKQSLIKCQKDYECAAMERDALRRSNDRLLHIIKNLAKENCEKCEKARVKGESLACCNCKWSDINEWKVD